MAEVSSFRHNLTQVVLAIGVLSGCAEARLQNDAAAGGAPSNVGRDPQRPAALSCSPGCAGTGPDWVGASGAGGSGAGGSGAIGGWYSAGSPSDSMSISLCGNGMIDGNERCDGMNLNGLTCRIIGYRGGGELRCNLTTCQFDTIACTMGPAKHEALPDVPAADDDAGLVGVCVPGGQCQLTDQLRGICADDGLSCENCVSNAQCQLDYGGSFLCFGDVCSIPL
jgi:hypothetical protein